MALYSAAVLDVFGEHWCEMAVDAGPLMTAAETLALGETWIATALGHINNQPGGDFVMPYGIATSAVPNSAGSNRTVQSLEPSTAKVAAAPWNKNGPWVSGVWL